MDFEFPEGFLWGAATASYQIEGAINENARGRSTWDVFCDEPGRITNGDSGDTACDHYHRWPEDIELMKELNLAAYRFSLAWPRIIPDGEGAPSESGLAFYDRLVDSLLEAGIEPWITLFHWDLPYTLQERYKGWQSRETPRRFADYAALCGRRLGDRVKNWFTINEIRCFTESAHGSDRMAPGGILPRPQVNQTIHHAMLGHGLALRRLRDTVKDARIGLVENLTPVWPIYTRDDHIQAARSAFREMNAQILFPVLTGSYDAEVYERNFGAMPRIAEDDMEIIASPTDFIAYNYYFGEAVTAADNERGFEIVKMPDDFPKTDMGWNITPRGLYWTLIFSSDFFRPLPVYITENGQAAADTEERDGSVRDTGRLEYYRRHLEMASRAISDGADLRGYFAWSLLDNFEWAMGYSKRFGLARVNYRTQKRTIKLSGRYYADVIQANRVL